MTQEGAVPPSYNEYIRRVIREEIANYARSGASRNMSIGEGGRLTLKGGQLRVLYPEAEGGGIGVYFGDLYSAITGVYQGTGLLVQDADGTDIASFRSDLSGNPLVVLRDGNQNAVFYTDTVTGQGIVRPYIPTAFYRQRFADWTVSTTSATFEGLWKAEVIKQHPKLSVATQASMDTAGTTGEVRVLVDGVELGTTQAIGYGLTVDLFGPADVAGAHMNLLTVEIQGRVTSGAGALKVEPLHMLGR